MGAETASTQTGPAGTVLVVNKDDRTLMLVDAQKLQVVSTVQLSGITGHEVAVHPDLPIAYVPIYSDAPVGVSGTDGSTIDVIDLVRGQRSATIDLKAPCRPHDAMFGLDGLLYVTTELNKSVTVIDPSTQQVVRTLKTGHAQSHMMALSPDGTYCYTANVEPGSISEIDVENGHLLRTVEVAEVINRISLSADGLTAFTADQRQPRLAVVDLVTGSVNQWVELPSTAFGTALTPNGTELILALRGSNQIAKLNLKTLEIVAAADVAPSPQMIVLDPTGAIAYTASSQAGLLTAVRLSDMSAIGAIETGRNPDGLAFANIAV
ncbi:YncE family protein [Arthrobacter sulfonylureivorans]|uniref:YncE family protein n=1 Tax=Arthrobacter sulfonylureivorans TaxID=2486855 RepID=UPI0039E4C01D